MPILLYMLRANFQPVQSSSPQACDQKRLHDSLGACRAIYTLCITVYRTTCTIVISPFKVHLPHLITDACGGLWPRSPTNTNINTNSSAAPASNPSSEAPQGHPDGHWHRYIHTYLMCTLLALLSVLFLVSYMTHKVFKLCLW